MNAAAPLDALRENPPQALVLGPTRHRHVRHVLCHEIAGRREGWRHFLHGVAHQVTWWHDDPHGTHLTLGLTHRGLVEGLELPAHVRLRLHELAPAFYDGAALRASRLGDTGLSAPRLWDARYAPSTLLGVITLQHDDPTPLQRCFDALEARARHCNLALRFHDGALIGHPPGEVGEWVHFGYRDGLSRVHFKEFEPGAERAVALGEVLLGQPREAGDNPWQLARLPRATREVFRHGSFGVLRQVAQDAHGFEQWVERAAARLKPPAPAHALPDHAKAFVKAKLCGRWPDGRLFAGTDWDTPQGDLGRPPAFLPPQGDDHGYGCPFGAHVRRMSPGGTVHARTRVLVRCSRPYGPANWSGANDGVDRGLLGQFFCASLEDQFEHLVAHWADQVPLGSLDRGDAKDPLIGAHQNPLARFELPAPGGSQWLDGFQPFVRTRGTVYAFYPSRRGLQRLLDDRDLIDAEASEYLA